MSDKNEQHLDIELGEDVSVGVYSNLAVIAHSQGEFVTDFIQLMPGVPKGKVQSRVIMTPLNAKRFARALSENIHKYEQAFGEINEEEQHTRQHITFGTPTTEA